MGISCSVETLGKILVFDKRKKGGIRGQSVWEEPPSLSSDGCAPGRPSSGPTALTMPILWYLAVRLFLLGVRRWLRVLCRDSTPAQKPYNQWLSYSYKTDNNFPAWVLNPL